MTDLHFLSDKPLSPERQFANAFREAAPYIHFLRGKTLVLALSSFVVASPQFLRLAEDMSLLNSLGVQLVLVHGVRHYIDELSQQAGVAIARHQGKRITDERGIELAKQACGTVRFQIEAALSMSMANSPQHGVRVHVASGNFLVARPLGVLDGVDMGFTGAVRRVDKKAIHERLADGDLVLVSPIGHSYSGGTFNLSLEEVASRIAIELRAEKLVFLGQEEGMRDSEGEIISAASFDELMSLAPVDGQSAYEKRILPAVQEALNQGVNRVHILSGLSDGDLLAELFTRNGAGTAIAKSSLVHVRQAVAYDITDILQLIKPLEDAGVLMRRGREYLENHIDEFYVLEHDEQIYGCVALKPYPDTQSAELACLVVSPSIRDEGYGEILLRHIVRQARSRGLTSLFALTTHTSDWFLERGFTRARLEALPPERVAEYQDNKRASKIFSLNLASAK